MKKLKKILGVLLIGSSLISLPTTLLATSYSVPSIALNLTDEGVDFEDDYFELGPAYASGVTYRSSAYSSYAYYPNVGNSLKVRIDMYDYNAYKFVPWCNVYCYELSTNKLIESKSLRCYLQSNYLTFDNLDPGHAYYIKFSITNASMAGVLYVSADGTYSMRY